MKRYIAVGVVFVIATVINLFFFNEYAEWMLFLYPLIGMGAWFLFSPKKPNKEK